MPDSSSLTGLELSGESEPSGELSFTKETDSGDLGPRRAEAPATRGDSGNAIGERISDEGLFGDGLFCKVSICH